MRSSSPLTIRTFSTFNWTMRSYSEPISVVNAERSTGVRDFLAVPESVDAPGRPLVGTSVIKRSFIFSILSRRLLASRSSSRTLVKWSQNSCGKKETSSAIKTGENHYNESSNQRIQQHCFSINQSINRTIEWFTKPIHKWPINQSIPSSTEPNFFNQQTKQSSNQLDTTLVKLPKSDRNWTLEKSRNLNSSTQKSLLLMRVHDFFNKTIKELYIKCLPR